MKFHDITHVDMFGVRKKKQLQEEPHEFTHVEFLA
jgi:hypothetical protein